MKLSLSWVFDHINAELAAQDVDALLIALGKTTAEIDGVVQFSCDWKRFFVATVHSIEKDSIVVFIPELKKNLSLPLRDDVQVGEQVLLLKDDGYAWATYQHIGGDRSADIPTIYVPEEQVAGAWREVLESVDWIIDIDNKSLTNRPDLWGHRGFAREIAAILHQSLVDEERISPDYPVSHFEICSPHVVLEDVESCNRFATISVCSIENRSSSLAIVSRLARIGGKAISGIVDLTNYVMFDIGHPMHAFDGAVIQGSLVVRRARSGERLLLLDGSELLLAEQDCVVADDHQVLSLAGIMGGAASGITAKTERIILEAAHFNASAIRISSQRAKVRTDSSMRFEKGLDPHANIIALERYIALLRREGFSSVADPVIASVGRVFSSDQIALAHRLLTDRLGCAVVESDVIAILQRLGFGVNTEQGRDGGLVYVVSVPLFRGYKDVKIAEDIIEEVARFIGYDSIPQIMPKRSMRPFSIQSAMSKRAIRQICAFGCGMREVARYSLFDEAFLTEAGIVVDRAQELKNPLSQNMFRLVTSLIPHALQAVQANAILRDEVRFFEIARTWKFAPGAPREALPQEKEQLAGILFARKNLDFYDAKQVVMKLFDSCSVYPEWRSVAESSCPVWFDSRQTAEIFIKDVSYGFVGAVHPDVLQRLVDGKSCAFAFELRLGGLLLDLPAQEYTYAPLSRYQSTLFDVSLFAPLSLSVDQIETALASLDARIREVALVDMFEKSEWTDGRALTIRYMVQDDEHTLTKQELDDVQARVVAAVQSLGGVVR